MISSFRLALPNISMKLISEIPYALFFLQKKSLFIKKILNFISAMMSILGLQTAMISRFSENGDNYRKTMNAITGGFVYCIVIFVAVFMLICSRKNKKEGGNR